MTNNRKELYFATTYSLRKKILLILGILLPLLLCVLIFSGSLGIHFPKGSEAWIAFSCIGLVLINVLFVTLSKRGIKQTQVNIKQMSLGKIKTLPSPYFYIALCGFPVTVTILYQLETETILLVSITAIYFLLLLNHLRKRKVYHADSKGNIRIDSLRFRIGDYDEVRLYYSLRSESGLSFPSKLILKGRSKPTVKLQLISAKNMDLQAHIPPHFLGDYFLDQCEKNGFSIEYCNPWYSLRKRWIARKQIK
ncbi:MAG: hypothetical protein EP338_04380 [Bacteroidetes bacterium]|nr:MAG: hypothetical protein EP338_04380 [Bacteroidota bacterium]